MWIKDEIYWTLWLRTDILYILKEEFSWYKKYSISLAYFAIKDRLLEETF